MSLLYVNENGATIGVEANKCVVQYRDGMKKMIPIESLEGITIMGQSHLTTKCAEECMCRGISVAYFSKGGKYFGRLMSMIISMFKGRENKVLCMIQILR